MLTNNEEFPGTKVPKGLKPKKPRAAKPKVPKPPKVKKPKLKSVGVLTKEAAKLLQRLVRVKAADETGLVSCVTCGKRDHWKNMQGGHFISRVYLSTLLVEENLASQCVSCNVFKAKDGLVLANYYDYMVDMYGKEFVDELRKMALQPKVFKRDEITALRNEFETRLIELEKRFA